MGTHGNEPLNSLSLRKSNDFISAKYKSTLLENQVMAIALTKIEVDAKDKDAPLQAKLYPGDLKKLVSDPAHIYRDLKKLAKSITGHTMFLEDGKGNFKAFSVVPNADYIDGVFIIKFNNELRDHVLGLTSSYTNLELAVMTDFKRNTSFRLYEVLKKDAYKIPKNTSTVDEPRVQVEYNISELRFIIGLANSDDQMVKNAMANMGKDINWDDLYEKLDKKDKKYEEWRDFQRRILKPAQEELAEKSDIRFDYEGLREGRKTKRILFTIYRNIPSNPEIIDERQRIIDENTVPFRQLEMPYDTYPELYDELIGHNDLCKEDITLLLKKADYNPNKVREAVEMADEASNNSFINNYMGWLIKCLEEGWGEKGVVEGSSDKAAVVTAVMDEYDKADKEGLAKKSWDRIKSKPEFAGFIEAIEEEGMDVEQMEVIYSYQELTKAYTDFRLGKGISL